MSGKTILVDNTDAEGRLVLADALAYEFGGEEGETPDGSVDLEYLEEVGVARKMPLWRDDLKSVLKAGDS